MFRPRRHNVQSCFHGDLMLAVRFLYQEYDVGLHAFEPAGRREIQGIFVRGSGRIPKLEWFSSHLMEPVENAFPGITVRKQHDLIRPDPLCNQLFYFFVQYFL